MRAVIDRLLRRTWKGGLISREFLHRSIDFGPGFIPNSCYTNFLPLIKVTQMERLLTKFLQNFQQRNSLYCGQHRRGWTSAEDFCQKLKLFLAVMKHSVRVPCRIPSPVLCFFTFNRLISFLPRKFNRFRDIKVVHRLKIRGFQRITIDIDRELCSVINLGEKLEFICKLIVFTQSGIKRQTQCIPICFRQHGFRMQQPLYPVLCRILPDQRQEHLEEIRCTPL